jgi:PKD repeat protein
LQIYIEPNLAADFYADQTTICSGSTTNFTNLSTSAETYLWTFEGGTPSTSTDENPSVVYDTPGVYDVTLEATFGTESVTETKTDYITVLETPAKADMPIGDTEICSGSTQLYETTELNYASAYEWEVSPADAGSITWENTIATFEADASWTGDFTVSVRGTNQCGDGEWSDFLECTTFVSPTEFTLEGDNSYCLGGDGVEITLDGSQTGVDYELYLDGVSTGIIVAGTDTEISFGFVTEEGFYEATGFNTSCSQPMSGQIQVSVEYPPLEPQTPSGPTSICEEATSDYSTTDQDDADSFAWILSPAEAGSITGTGTEAQVIWDETFSGMAYVSVYGINNCGDGNPSETLEINVGSPSPEISGESMVCDFSDETYEVANNEGSTYTWEITGGSVAEGQGTNMITVAWEGVGTGSVMVMEQTADGCSGDSEVFDITIDDCTGIDEFGNNEFTVSPNPGTDYILLKGDFTKNYMVNVYTLSGQLKLETEITGNNARIDISMLPQGIFLIKVMDQNSVWGVSKLVKN